MPVSASHFMTVVSPVVTATATTLVPAGRVLPEPSTNWSSVVNWSVMFHTSPLVADAGAGRLANAVDPLARNAEPSEFCSSVFAALTLASTFAAVW